MAERCSQHQALQMAAPLMQLLLSLGGARQPMLGVALLSETVLAPPQYRALPPPLSQPLPSLSLQACQLHQGQGGALCHAQAAPHSSWGPLATSPVSDLCTPQKIPESR